MLCMKYSLDVEER